MEANGVGTNGASPAKVVADVHQQLQSGFQPATKLVAECGNNLLRCFQGLQKTSDAYIRALEGLARSGKNAYGEGKRKAAELEMVVATMKSVNIKHKENIEKFGLLVTKTNEYSRDEKEKLKEMSHSYEGREKAIKKAVGKGIQDPLHLEKFYSDEMESAIRQQSQRYKFSADRHSEWLRSYVELLQLVNLLLSDSKQENDAQTSSSPAPDAQGTADPASIQQNESQTPQALPSESADKEILAKNVDENEASKPTASKEVQSVIRIRDQKIESPKLREAGTMYEDHEGNAPIVMGEDPVLENFILAKPPDSKPPIQSRQIQTTPEVDYGIENDVYPGIPKHANRNIEAPKDEYTPIRYKEPVVENPHYASILKESWQKPAEESSPSLESSRQPVPRSRSAYGEKPPIATRGEEHRPLTQANGAIFRPTNINAIPTAIIPPAFGAADNGKLLVCIHNFHGQTANQLSLSMNDRIVLIKSGAKGWIFAKHVETQRTGWFPSRFVKLLPDAPDDNSL